MHKNNFFIVFMILASVWMCLDLAEGWETTKNLHLSSTVYWDSVDLAPETVKPKAPVITTTAPIVEKKPAVAVAKIDKKVEVIAPVPVSVNRITKKKYRLYGVWYFSPEDPKQDLINYAYKKGGRDFLLTLNGENGTWSWDRKSDRVWSNGYSDYGLCQLNGQYHAKFIFANGQNIKGWWGKDFKDPYKQVDYCLEVWHDAIRKGRIKTTFYAYKNRESSADWFVGLK